MRADPVARRIGRNSGVLGLLGTLMATAVLAGCGPAEGPGLADTVGGTAGSTSTSVASTATSGRPTALPEQAPVELAVADPVQVSVPSVGIDSTLGELGLTPGGELEAPSEWDVAGWYAGGPAPGERGPAVIAGHVDSPNGPAVFWRLREVAVGDAVRVTRADGTAATFQVTRTLSVAQDEFPTAEVYGPTPASELRLITCDGPYDRAAGRYEHNLVVFATATEV